LTLFIFFFLLLCLLLYRFFIFRRFRFLVVLRIIIFPPPPARPAEAERRKNFPAFAVLTFFALDILEENSFLSLLCIYLSIYLSSMFLFVYFSVETAAARPPVGVKTTSKIEEIA
jgi:hypothetical protein